MTDFRCIKKIKTNIKNKFNVILSKSSIYHILHKNNLTYKKIYIKNNPYNEEENNKFKIDLKNKIYNIDINNILSYDEMSIYLNVYLFK